MQRTKPDLLQGAERSLRHIIKDFYGVGGEEGARGYAPRLGEALIRPLPVHPAVSGACRCKVKSVQEGQSR